MKCITTEITMFPTVSINNEEILDKFLNIFEEDNEIYPAKWGTSERPKLKYNKEKVKNIILDKNQNKQLLFLYGDAIKNNYTGFMSIDNELSGRFHFKFNYKKEDLYKFYIILDKLVELLKPRFCVSNPSFQDFIIEDKEKRKKLNYIDACCTNFSALFFANGPLGLGVRTYFDKETVEYFGKDNFLYAPAFVKEMSGGEIRIDLLKELCNLNLEEILKNWTELMRYFEKLELFAVPTICNSEGIIIRTKPNNKWGDFSNYIRNKNK